MLHNLWMFLGYILFALVFGGLLYLIFKPFFDLLRAIIDWLNRH